MFYIQNRFNSAFSPLEACEVCSALTVYVVKPTPAYILIRRFTTTEIQMIINVWKILHKESKLSLNRCHWDGKDSKEMDSAVLAQLQGRALWLECKLIGFGGGEFESYIPSFKMCMFFVIVISLPGDCPKEIKGQACKLWYKEWLCCCLVSATPWTVAHQAPLSMAFSRLENWSGFHFLLQGIFLTQELNSDLLDCRQIIYQLSYEGSPEVSSGSWEELPHVQGVVAAWAQKGWEELLSFKVRRGGPEEIPLVQGKEQQLQFAGATMTRYPTSKVRETQVRWQVLQEASEGRHTNYTHRKLVNLITHHSLV